MKYELKKAKAMEFMTAMDIYSDYIEIFKNSGMVCLFERFGGYYVEENTDLYHKMKVIENKYKCVVYAITHEVTEFGECYSFLLVTDRKSEWKTLVESFGNKHTAFAYVWNKDDEWCSEFGSINVQSFGGGIRRIA